MIEFKRVCAKTSQKSSLYQNVPHITSHPFKIKIIELKCTLRVILGDGNWSEWDEWGSCSEACGTGSQTRSRSCDNPAPIHGGSDCDGIDVDEQSCNEEPCPGMGYSVMHSDALTLSPVASIKTPEILKILAYNNILRKQHVIMNKIFKALIKILKNCIFCK